jgi:glycosyltransferase involved in cell wall biosynthesis
MNSLIFSISTSILVLFDRANTIVFSSGPVTVLIPFFFKRVFSRKQLVVEHRDLWPDGAIEMGLLNGWKAKVADIIVNWCNQRADQVVVCSDGMRDVLKARGIKSLNTIPHGCDLTLRNLQEEITLPDWTESAIIFLYAGSLGLMDAVDDALDGFIKSNLNENCHLVILGSGADEDCLKHKATQSAKSNKIHFYGLVSKNVMAQWYRIAHASFVLFKNYPILSSSSPNKLFDSLVFGVPIIQNTSGWIQSLVLNKNIGYNVRFGHSESMKNAIERSLCDSKEHSLKSKNARTLAIQSLSRNEMANKYIQIFNAK